MWQAYSSADQILGAGRVRIVSPSVGSPRSLAIRIPNRPPSERKALGTAPAPSAS